MKIVATDFGDPGVLTVTSAQARVPRAEEVAIGVRAAGVNPRDYKVYRDPSYARASGQPAPQFPIPLGVEAAGVVIAVGEDAYGPAGPIQGGDEVIAYRITGAYATRLVVDAANVIPKPTRLTWAQAASMMLVGTTAAHCLASVRARPGETILIHGAAGGVGLSAVQLAAIDEIAVVGVCSEPDFPSLRRYVAIPVGRGPGLGERIAAAVPDRIDAAIDLVGSDRAIDVSLELVADRSRIVTVVSSDHARSSGIQSIGGSPGQDERGIAIRDNARLRLTALAQVGAFDINVARTFPLAEARGAHELLARGGAGGRIVLTAYEESNGP
jgi:NADPH2:quinone reductase